MLIAEDLSVHFNKGISRKKIKALDGLNIEVQKGDFFALLGQNGAGKSTAMYCFLGLIKPTSGSVRVFGKSPVLGTEMYEKIAYLPEEPHYHTYLTVGEAVTYYGTLYGKKVSPKKVNEILDRLGLLEFKDLRVSKCSKGMKQKVGIAQCIINRPEILFLDEPTRGLDPIIVKEFRDILVGLNKEGATIVMNSHILSEIELVANRVAIIDRGKVVVQDALDALLKLDTEVYTVEFGPDDGNAPEYVTGRTKTDTGIKAEVPAERFYDFMDYTKNARLKVFECYHKKKTLEESYFSILKGSPGNA